MKLEKEQKDNKRKVIIASSISIVALLLIVGISYAFWQTTKIQEDTNIIASGCFEVSLEGKNPINLSSAYPMLIEEGMGSQPYTFTITNTCNSDANYVVNLEALEETTFNSSSIRVALDENNKLFNEYEEAEKYYETSKEARTLISGTLTSNENVTYNLRMWIDEETPVTEQSKVFKSKIIVTTGQNGQSTTPEIMNLEATSTIDTISITYNVKDNVVSATCKWGIEKGIYNNEAIDVTLTNCNITGLLENTTYYYQICTDTEENKCIEGNIKTQQEALGETDES